MRVPAWFIGVLCLALASVGTAQSTTDLQPNTDFQPDTSPIRFARWMVTDAGALAKATFTPRVGLYALGAGVYTAAGAAVDSDLQDAVQDVYSGGFRAVLVAANDLGGPRGAVPVVLLAVGSLAVPDTKLQDAAWTSLQTVVYAGMIGYGLKGLFGRLRPEATDDPYAFFETTGQNPFVGQGNSSFPSGHTIASFSLITPWVVYYPSPFTYALYALPTATALNRVAIDKHWTTDIVVGALVGISVGRFLSRRHQRLQRNE
ncbi:MAG: phosphatase PAP2 family protein, partial [Bacteroidota bacterium]